MTEQVTKTRFHQYIEELENAIIELNQVKALGLNRYFQAEIMANDQTGKIDLIFYSDIEKDFSRPQEGLYAPIYFSSQEAWEKADWDPLLDFINGIKPEEGPLRPREVAQTMSSSFRGRLYAIFFYYKKIQGAGVKDYNLLTYYKLDKKQVHFLIYPKDRLDIQLDLKEEEKLLFHMDPEGLKDLDAKKLIGDLEEDLKNYH
ncbi:MAG: hypothetical protein Q4E37_06290 [Tissierellia bacterium]|nr:hypothetical protein [Tissierellia bacterium]